MCSIRILSRSLLALAGPLVLAGAASAQTVVVGASGPSARSYPAGRTLAAGTPIVLAAGDTLTVLDSNGTRTLRGPAMTSAQAATTDRHHGFAALVATQNRRRARTGAVRGSGESARPANLWQIDLTREGTYCVSDPAALQLWRPDMEQAATLTVTPPSGPGAGASFAVGQNAVAWPASVPIAQGRDYMVSGEAVTRPVRVRLVMLDAPASEPAGTWAALDAKGCSAQKQLLLEALQAPQ